MHRAGRRAALASALLLIAAEGCAPHIGRGTLAGGPRVCCGSLPTHAHARDEIGIRERALCAAGIPASFALAVPLFYVPILGFFGVLSVVALPVVAAEGKWKSYRTMWADVLHGLSPWYEAEHECDVASPGGA